MVARTSREILRWLEGLYLTYPVVIPKWDLSNGYSYAEILHAYFPNEINMFSYINGRSINSRLSNWSLTKQFIKKKNLPIPLESIDGTIHGKDGAAENLLEKTYEIFTNNTPYRKSTVDESPQFTTENYQRSLSFIHRSNASKTIKANLKISELQTDPSIAFQSDQSMNWFLQSKKINQTSRQEQPERFNIKPTLAERCLRQPIRTKSNTTDWMTKSFAAYSQANSDANNLTRKSSLQMSVAESNVNVLKPLTTEGPTETSDELDTYKEIVIKQHSVPYSSRLNVEYI